jgi:hypothetical protein
MKIVNLITYTIVKNILLKNKNSFQAFFYSTSRARTTIEKNLKKT